MIKNNFRILKKPHANLQTIAKAPVKFQKDWPKTVGGVEGTRYLLKIRNHAPRTTESRKQCPSAFLRKGGGQQNDQCAQQRLRSAWVSAQSDQSLCCPHAETVSGSLATHEAHNEDWSDGADAQADLSHHWANRPLCWFCRAAAQIWKL